MESMEIVMFELLKNQAVPGLFSLYFRVFNASD